MRQRWATWFLSGIKGLLLAAGIGILIATPAWATEFHGQVVFGGLPVPGAQATVTATQGDKTVSAVTDDQGLFAFPDLTDGAWTITITLTGFAPLKEPITVAPNSPIPVFELKLETLAQIQEEASPVKVEPGAAPQVSSASVAPAPTPTAGSAPASVGTDASARNPPAKNAAAKGQTQQAANANPDAPAPPPTAAQEASAAQAPDGLLINGSVNNAATSQFSLAQAFGNARNSHSLYNYGLMFRFDSSSLDAKTYSITGIDEPKPSYQNFIAGVQFGGPLKIPHLLPAYRAPNLQVGYQRTQNASVSARQALVPTAAEAGGNLAGIATLAPNSVIVPSATLLSGPCLATGVTPGQPFPNNTIPANCINPIAAALLKFYPAQNVNGLNQYNYQIPLSTDVHEDELSVRMQKQFGNKNNVNGQYALDSFRQSNPNIFVDQQGHPFVDAQDNLGMRFSPSWYHRFTQRLSANFSYNFSRQRNDTRTAFENKQNVSQQIGITGNDQAEAANWGPPSLGFSQSGIAGLSDGNSRHNRNQTQSLSVNFQWNRFRHNMQMGGDFRRQQWNYFQQSNPRGTLTFSGSSPSPTGSDFADFLLGLPDTSQIAYGNADKYLRQSVYDLFFDDDFRVSPELSVHYGVRWEYGAPVTETKDRLVNLDFSQNFAAQAPVLATSPVGALSGRHYPTSLMQPDKNGFAPTVAIAWRPISGSSLLVRSSYGLYHDTSVYQATAYAMANQAPCPVFGVSCNAPWAFTSLSEPRAGNCSLTLATPFLPCGGTTPDTFSVDPNFRVGYAQAWNLSLQRDLPAALQMVVTYSGIKGTRGVEEILPNTFPTAPVCAVSPCSGYYYRMSNGNSTREAGTVQLRRRLRAGFQANASYTFSKSLDDDYSYGGSANVATGNSSGTPQVAQDWRHPQAQRGLSTFDQRHVLALQAQYTTGMGLGGRALMSGWRGAIYKEWTILANINMASGLPLTPTYFSVMPGTAYTGIIRPNYVAGQPIHQVGANANGIRTYLNPNAFTPPAPGQFGNAPRDFITGPSQFGLNASMQRGFRLHDRYNLTAEIDANNVLNHVTFTGWNTTVLPTVGTTANSQFGTATSANGMRSVSITLRMRY